MDRTDVLVVADDFTGAADTGHRFAERGYETSFEAGERGPEEPADVRVLSTDSRGLPATTAADRVAAAVAATDAAVCYKKVDSTLRGNVAGEVDAALDARGGALAVVAPAFPAQGRRTVGDVHVVDGTPVARTAAGDGPGAPSTSRLSALLADSAHPVERLDLETAASGPAAVAERLSSAAATHDAPPLVACDAARDAHLRNVALGAARLGDVLYVGSAGLAAHVPVGDPDREVVGVVGSVHDRTLAQLAELDERIVVDVDGPAVVRDAGCPVDDAVERARAALDAHGRAVVTAAREGTAVDAAFEAAAAAGVDDREARRRVAASLGRVARQVAETRTPDGLFVTGGAVAERVLDALDADRLDLTGDAVASGVPVARIRGGAAAGTPVVTKAGGFGDARTILTALDRLSSYRD